VSETTESTEGIGKTYPDVGIQTTTKGKETSGTLSFQVNARGQFVPCHDYFVSMHF